MNSIWRDVSYTFRTWGKHPGFTAIAMLTIALGVGATASIFSIVNGVLLAPLPLNEPEKLVIPEVISSEGYEISLSIPNFKDWRERNRTFESFGANAGRSYTLTGEGRPEIVSARIVIGDFFEVLAAVPAMGRTLSADETWAGAEPVAVITHGFWQRALEGDPDAIGRTITLDAQPFTVVGVMPKEFVFPSAETQVYLPMGFFSERMCWEVRGCS